MNSRRERRNEPMNTVESVGRLAKSCINLDGQEWYRLGSAAASGRINRTAYSSESRVGTAGGARKGSSASALGWEEHGEAVKLKPEALSTKQFANLEFRSL